MGRFEIYRRGDFQQITLEKFYMRFKEITFSLSARVYLEIESCSFRLSLCQM